jgi:hypothetical protein
VHVHFGNVEIMLIGQNKGKSAAVAELPLAERPAPIAELSRARRSALIDCYNAGGLVKKNGAWHGPPDRKALSGATIADLAREQMLTVTKSHGFGSAQLTDRGRWFARTLLDSGPH